MTRALVLTRVSSDEQTKNNSPSAQETDGKAYAEKHGLSVIDILNEDYTGTTIDRPVFNRVLELADAGAIGLVTTHDLALTALAASLAVPASNVHFEDRIEDGRMVFDYRMREGVVERSNALELMRAVGLKV